MLIADKGPIRDLPECTEPMVTVIMNQRQYDPEEEARARVRDWVACFLQRNLDGVARNHSNHHEAYGNILVHMLSLWGGV
jgi:hypothetical protein